MLYFFSCAVAAIYVYCKKPKGEAKMILKTERLILRPWRESDAESLYKYAKNPKIGPIAGWPIHTSVENSREIIENVLSAEETYAVTRREDDIAIGSIGLIIGKDSSLGLGENEAEIGYWLAEPFWGQGLIPEAARELIRYAFEDLKHETLWCGYFEENEKSKRVSEKCGFRYHRTEYETHWELINVVKNQQVTRLTREEWLSSK